MNPINHFSKLENKYYYGFSRTVWHIITAIFTLVIIGSILIFLWSYSPVFKSKVKKPNLPQKEAYPNQIEVSVDEIIDNEKIEVKYVDTAKVNFIAPPKSVEVVKDTTGLSAFEKQISNLKIILPYNEFKSLWDAQGYYYYLDEYKYNMTHQEKYREWVELGPDLRGKIVASTNNNNFNSFNEKAKLLSEINNIIKKVQKQNRENILNYLLDFKNENLEKTIKSFKAASDNISLFDPDNQYNALKINLSFINNNPKDGFLLVEFQKEVLPKIMINQRYDFVRFIILEYQSYYNNNLSGIKENINGYLNLIKQIPSEKQSLSLRKYFEVYRDKNASRLYKINEIENKYNEQVAEIESKYNSEVMAAEAKQYSKKSIKKSFRSKSLIALSIGMGGILLITLILLNLSMIRNVNKLAEAMLQEKNEN